MRPEGTPETKAIFEQWKCTLGNYSEQMSVKWGSWHTDIATAFTEYYHKQMLEDLDRPRES